MIRGIKIFTILSLLFCITFPFQYVAAQGDILDPITGEVIGTSSLPVSEVASLPTTKQTLADRILFYANQVYEKGKDYLDTTAAIAYRTGVRTFLSIIVNDVGEWLGSGGYGQKPLIFTDQYGDYLQNVADTAAGAVIDQVIQDGYLGAFGVCNPNLDLQLRINLGITNYNPPYVSCKFSDLQRNWSRAIRSENFLPDFKATFDPGQNDLGIALTAHSNLLEKQQRDLFSAYADRQEGVGFKSVVDAISGKIIAPSQDVKNTSESTKATSFNAELKNTGDIVGDSVDVFLNAVARGFVTSLVKGCFWGNCASGVTGGNGIANLFNPDAQADTGGVAAARARLAQEINPSFSIRGRYNVVSEMVACSDSSNPGPKNCVIDDDFATAINRRLTVKQAVEEGLVRGDRPFGFISQGEQSLEPSITDGIPYRSILILRTYRIVPVGWEIAARYIGKFEEKRVTLNQLMNEYDNEDSAYFGLVDPNWVLVAPDAFCKLSGPGPQVISSRTLAGQDNNGDGDYNDVGDVPPVLQQQRAANYCADEQTCIKNDDSGACQFYGYCLEERPSLDFNGSSCEARFATCTTLENETTGQVKSYLLNTVDFAGCTAGDIGCQKYATWQRLDVPVDSDIRWNLDRTDAKPVYLNSRAEGCDPDDTGCHAYIRVTGVSESNDNFGEIETSLATLRDTDSSNDVPFTSSTETIHLQRAPDWMGCRGCQAANLDQDDSSVSATDVSIVSGWLSACPAGELRWPCDDGDATIEELEQVNIAFQQGTCSQECTNYAPFCSANEVGCQAYTPTNGNPTVTAVSGQQCGSECVGFDVYTQTPSFFDPSPDFETFIPSSARSCSVSDAGCTAFTNLAKEGAGGEAREYYQQIRYCQLPSQTDYKVFYSWEGSDDTGYQLRSFQLKNSNLEDAPCTNLSWNSDGTTASCIDSSSNVNNAACNENNYRENSDCRQFYSGSNAVSYRLLSKTIAISEDCVPLRRNANLLDTAADRKACDGTVEANGTVTKVGMGSGGYWNTSINACIYQVLQTESLSCSAAATGCRLYQGGTSANYQSILSVNFESDTGGFTGGQLSAVSPYVGGHSYMISSTARITLPLNPGQSTAQDGSKVNTGFYKLSFYARTATGNSNLQLRIDNTTLPNQSFALDSNWRLIEVDPFSTTVTTGNEMLISNPASNNPRPDIYIDDIKINTSVNTFAVIQNSWSTPASCYLDNAVNDPSKAMLGCQAYNVSNNTKQNIWNFGKTCAPKFVGCEALVDTQNTTTGPNQYAEQTFAKQNITVPADKVDYLVNQAKYRCNGSAQGCMTLGLADTDSVNQTVKWSTVNLLNNPDRYNSILCGEESVDCTAFTGSNTTYYFKDPKSKVCEYRTDKPISGWYKPGSQLNTPDCQSGAVQKTFADKNIGAGPTVGWVGLCSAAQNSCTEYIDPQSKGQSNLLENGRFTIDGSETNGNNVKVPRGWFTFTDTVLTSPTKADDGSIRVQGSYNATSGIRNGLFQSVRLEPHTLYTLSADVKKGDSENSFAFAGLTNCSFESAQYVNVNCASGGINSDGSVSDTQVAAAKSNVANGCGVGVCVGDFNNDRVVTTDELLTMISINNNALIAQCSDNYQPIFNSPDSGLIVQDRKAGPSDSLVFGNILKPISGDKVERLSSRFYFNTSSAVSCDVVIGTEAIYNGGAPANGGHWFKEVSLRKADTYYQLASKVDRTSCAGNVNNADCVLLNERSVNLSTFASGQNSVGLLAGYSSTLYDADNTATGAPNAVTRIEYGKCEANKCDALPGKPACQTDFDCQLHFDANTVIKVKPTRQCNAWLSCRTARTIVQNGVSKQVCLEVESCEQINEKGECIRRSPIVANQNMTFNKATVDKLKNLSGYTTAGFTWDNTRTVEGNLPPANMEQVGQPVAIINGDFESSSQRGEPSGWIGWDNGNNMKAIIDPSSAEKAGVSYPAQGLGFLEVNANHTSPLNSENINRSGNLLVGNQPYVISALINTKHFTGENVEVRVVQVGDNGVTTKQLLELRSGYDWTRVSREFTPDVDVKYVYVQLGWVPKQNNAGQNIDTSGYWHVDDIKISPSLKYAVSGNLNSYQPQTCRLYPTDDAPACNYYNDAGLKAVGKRGYCLVPDPQNTNYCLQWWPVDSVVGEDLGEDRAGYDGPVPAYYCLATKDTFETVVENAKNLGPYQIRSIESGVTTEFGPGSAGSIILDNKNEVQVDLFPTDPDKQNYNGYGLGGVVDKPGVCNANLTLGGGRQGELDGANATGCELIVEFQASNQQSECAEFYVTKNFIDYQVGHWKERTNTGSGQPWETNGTQWTGVDLAWAKDSSGNVVNGPFDKFKIKACENNASQELVSLHVRPNYSCNYIVQAVSSDGRIKGYSSKLVSGADDKILDTASRIDPLYGATPIVRDDSGIPYGAVVPPPPIDIPNSWDSIGSISGSQPLYPLPSAQSVANAGVPYWCQNSIVAGSVNDKVLGKQLKYIDPSTNNSVTLQTSGICSYYGGNISTNGTNPTMKVAEDVGVSTALQEKLGQLFVETYGVWKWSPVGDGTYAYERSSTINDLVPPRNSCPNGVRPTSGQSCGIPPKITGIQLSPQVVNNIGTVTLSFNYQVDADQLPLVAYRVDWGDGSITTQTGLRLQNRLTAANAVRLTHNYSYDDTPSCTGNSDCIITPRVQIIDNWGWCNGNTKDSTAGGSHESSGQCTESGSAWVSEPTIRITP